MRVFLSFLGLGNYTPASYSLAERPATRSTPFVQVALLEHLAAMQRAPELVLVAMTRESRDKHWSNLHEVLKQHQQAWQLGPIEAVDISTSLDVASQWTTFEQLLSRIPPNSQLFVDLTNGFRAIPILFSSAIHFLVQTRNVELCGVYYGAFEQGQKEMPIKETPIKETPIKETTIVDMKDFYAINLWAEAVQRLLQDANPDALAELASTSTSLKVQNLGDPELVTSLRLLSAVLKNSDAPRVAEVASRVVSRAQELKQELSGTGTAARVLLDLLLDKFSQLATDGGTRRFSRDWYEVQLTMARVLLDHGLLMQGLTVLRELVVSWGEELALHAMASPDNPGRLAYLQDHKLREFRDGWFKNARLRVADPFFARLHLPVTQWRPEQKYDPDGTRLLGIMDGFFSAHFAPEVARNSFAFLKELGDLRNGFNHAWTAKQPVDHQDLTHQSERLFHEVERWTRHWLDRQVLGHGAAELQPAPPVPRKPKSSALAPCFVNLSNHPVATWSPAQLDAARALGHGEPLDLPDALPLVPPEADAPEVAALADDLVARTLALGATGAHVAGEYSLTHALVTRLQPRGIPCYLATTHRDVVNAPRPDGTHVKQTIFRFVRWRRYEAS